MSTRVLLLLSLFFPLTLCAHTLSPSYFPVAHISLVLGEELRGAFFIPPIAVLVNFAMGHLLLRQVSFWSDFWRATCLYLAARIGEGMVILLAMTTGLSKKFPAIGWSSSWMENLIPLVIILIGGLLFSIAVGAALYSKGQAQIGAIIWRITFISLVAYQVTLAYSWFMVAKSR